MVEPILVVCEGSSDVSIFREIVKTHKIKNAFFIEEVDWNKTGSGITSIGKQLNGLYASRKLEGRKLVVVIADNDTDPHKNFGKVQRQIKNAGHFGVPENVRTKTPPKKGEDPDQVPDIVVIMLPWDDEPGALETLLVNAAASRKKFSRLVGCVDAFVSCARCGGWSPSRLSKLKARCIFAGAAEKNADRPLYRAWKKDSGNPFPMSSRELKPLVRYLKELAAEFK